MEDITYCREVSGDYETQTLTIKHNIREITNNSPDDLVWCFFQYLKCIGYCNDSISESLQSVCNYIDSGC